MGEKRKNKKEDITIKDDKQEKKWHTVITTKAKGFSEVYKNLERPKLKRNIDREGERNIDRQRQT